MSETIGIVPTNPNPKPGNRPLVIAAVGLAVFVLLTAVVLILAHSGGNTPAGQSSAAPTPTPTPSPANPALGSSAPTYEGFDDLLNYGLSSDQESDLKYAFTKFAAAANLRVTEIDLGSIAIAPHDSTSASTNSTATFTATINKTTIYQARLVYSNLTAAELYLNNPQTGAQIFDSGLIDVYNGIGDN